MFGTRPAGILRHLEQTGLGVADATTDADLLGRFAASRDQAAFATLVRRHGPMVLSVCQRVTNHPQDAEDAFQAAFLVLARKAGALRSPGLLGNWLYGVAVRIAQRARRSAGRRRGREVPIVDVPGPVTSDPAADLGPILHEELARLPAHYRDAILLCDLRGESRADAARALGIPAGTLSSRLAGGRKRLAARLTQRGITLSVPALSATLATDRASAAVSEALVSKTCELVANWTTGALIPEPVLQLTQGGFPMRQTFLLGAVTAALATVGVVLISHAAGPPEVAAPPRLAGTPTEARAEALAAGPLPKTNEPATGFTTTPRLRQAIDLPVPEVAQVFWAPDGKGIAVRGEFWTADGRGGRESQANRVVIVQDAFERNPQVGIIDLPKSGTLVGFGPNGKTIITDEREYQLVSGHHRLQFWGLTAGQAVPGGPGPGAIPAPGGPGPGGRVGPGGPGGMPGPGAAPDPSWSITRTVNLDSDRTHGYVFAPDGKTFMTVATEGGPRTSVQKSVAVRVVDATTGETLRTPLTLDGEYKAYALSPTGSRFAAIDAATDRLSVWDVSKGEKISAYDLPQGPPELGLHHTLPVMSFSPDSRRLVVFRSSAPTVVLDTDRGEPLATLKGAELWSGIGRFTADGRLLALSGSQLVEVNRQQPGIGGQQQGFGVGPAGGRGAGGVAKKGNNPGLGGGGQQFPGGGPPGAGGGGQFGPLGTRGFRNEYGIGIWEVSTGKQLRGWDVSASIAVHPTRPVVAILEPNGGQIRLGLWDFAATGSAKK